MGSLFWWDYMQLCLLRDWTCFLWYENKPTAKTLRCLWNGRTLTIPSQLRKKTFVVPVVHGMNTFNWFVWYKQVRKRSASSESFFWRWHHDVFILIVVTIAVVYLKKTKILTFLYCVRAIVWVTWVQTAKKGAIDFISSAHEKIVLVSCSSYGLSHPKL